jgi:hypothetical protein
LWAIAPNSLPLNCLPKFPHSLDVVRQVDGIVLTAL